MKIIPIYCWFYKKLDKIINKIVKIEQKLAKETTKELLSKLEKYRKITVREAANLQSFRANYNFVCEPHISYKQLGNSVNVKVIKIIAKELFSLGIEGWDTINV